MKNFLLILFLALLIPFMTYAQEEAGSKWSLGVHAAPLFNFDNNNNNKSLEFRGFLFNPGAYLQPSSRLSIGFTPYYGRVSEKNYYAYNMQTNEFSDERRQTSSSVGLNVQFRYGVLKKDNSPYVMGFIGSGHTWDKIDYLSTDQETRKDSFFTMNYGFGIGQKLPLNETLSFDFSLQSGWVKSFDEGNPAFFIYPMVGLIKRF